MRKVFLVIALFALAALGARADNIPIILVQSAPSGACTNGQPMQLVIPTGVLYSCQAGTWGVVGAGAGGPPTGSAGGVLSGTYPNPGYAVAPVSSVSGTANQIDVTGTTMPVASIDSNLILPGSMTVPAGHSITITNDGVHPNSLSLPWNSTANAAPTSATGWEGYVGSSGTAGWFDLPSALPSSPSVMVHAAAALGHSVGTTTPLAGTGAGITTGPASSTNGDLASFTGTGGQIADSGVIASAVPYRAVAKLTGSAQAANIGSQTLVAVPATDTLYQICWYAAETRAATSSSTMPGVTITWNDVTDHVSRTYNLSGYNSSTGNATYVVGSQCNLFNAEASTNVQIVGTGYASSGATTMQYTYTAYAIALP